MLLDELEASTVSVTVCSSSGFNGCSMSPSLCVISFSTVLTTFSAIEAGSTELTNFFNSFNSFFAETGFLVVDDVLFMRAA